MSTSEDPSGTSTGPAPDPGVASTPPFTCKVEVEIAKGKKAIAKRVWINGVEIHTVTSVVVSYAPIDTRRVTITLMPTDFSERDIQPDTAGTIDGA